MIALDYHPSGRHFLQIPGPSPVPDRILRAMSLPTIDHRGPEFGGARQAGARRHAARLPDPASGRDLSGLGHRRVGSGAGQHAEPGRRVLMFETGHFASLWHKMAARLGLEARVPERARHRRGDGVALGWRRGVQADLIEARLRDDTAHAIKAVCVVHNETSTGVTSDIAAVRRAIDAAGHPALLLVDTISGLACADYRHDEWGVDVTVGGSQKGPDAAARHQLQRALAEGDRGEQERELPKAFWAWDEIVEMNKGGYWPYTPNTNLLYGLSESLDMMLGAGARGGVRAAPALGRGVRAAVGAWGLPIQCADASASIRRC